MADSGQCAFLDILGSEERTSLLARAYVVRARKGQMIVSRNQISRDVFIVQDGRLDVVIYAANGREVALRVLGAGQLFGELAAVDGDVRSANVVATTDARLLAIPSDDFRTIVLNSPVAATWLVERLIQQVRSLTNRVFELSALHVKARLHCELVRLYRLHGNRMAPAPTHSDLANRIGTHREAVTREFSALSQRKLIRSGRGTLEFLDPDGLESELRAILCAPVEDEGGW